MLCWNTRCVASGSRETSHSLEYKPLPRSKISEMCPRISLTVIHIYKICSKIYWKWTFWVKQEYYHVKGHATLMNIDNCPVCRQKHKLYYINISSFTLNNIGISSISLSLCRPNSHRMFVSLSTLNYSQAAVLLLIFLTILWWPRVIKITVLVTSQSDVNNWYYSRSISMEGVCMCVCECKYLFLKPKV